MSHSIYRYNRQCREERSPADRRLGDFVKAVKSMESAVMRIIWAILIVASLVPQVASADEKHPLSESVRKTMHARLEKEVSDATQRIDADPGNIGSFSRRADALFFLGRFAEAVSDYDAMVKLQPELETSHWRRGIARFYAGDYAKAAHQFEIYHSFDDVDRENGIWRFLSQAKSVGLEKAREGLLKYKKDDREPFPDVYELFAGKITPEAVLRHIRESELDADEREKRLFYAHLYIGLNHAVADRNEAARENLRLATANQWAPKAGFGPHYMWQVGRLHFERLSQRATQPAN